MSSLISNINVPTWSKYLIGAILTGAVVYVGGRLVFETLKTDSKPSKSEDLTKYVTLSENGKKSLKLKTKGNEYFKNKEYNDAYETYNQGIFLCDEKKDSQLLAELHQNAAATSFYLENIDKEIYHCNQALKYVPTFIKALKRRASAYEKKRSLKEAADDYLILGSLEPAHAAAHQNKARELYTEASLIVARYKFKQIPEEVRPLIHQQMFTYLFHSNIHNSLSNFVKKKKDCSVLDEEPIVHEIIKELREHKFDDAYQKCEEYLKNFDETKKIEFFYLMQILLLKCYITQRRYTLAKIVYENILNKYESEKPIFDEKILNNFMLSWKILGLELYFHISDEEGENFFNTQMGEYKENTDSYLSYGILKIASDANALAASSAKAQELDSNNIYATWYNLYSQCLACIIGGDYSSFIQKMKEFEDKLNKFGYNEDSYIGWFFLSQIFAVNDYEACSKILQKCSEIYPKYVINQIIEISLMPPQITQSSPENYALYMLKMKKVVDNVLKIDPFNTIGLKMKARICMEEGQTEEASKYLEEALKYASSTDEYAEVTLDTYILQGFKDANERGISLVQ
uniref:TPR_REGION domain-containing protein n=1 Tax=Parastrongyloides trichosuri TaxID=131310 RepID=A0A0N4ZMN8_PARTI